MNRTKHLIGKLGIVLCTALLGGTTYGQVSVSVGVEIRAESDFYEPLTPQGEWIVVGSYGRCWRPGHVDRDWRPYSEGYWQRTEAGWYWVSDEPWAWATYHYGRWDFTDQYGWYWVPQTEWAPAWVSWHSGGGYIGWAPLYPSGVTVIAPRAYVFVEERHFMEPVRRSTLVVNNTTIINQTTVINRTKTVNNTVINEGPATTVIEKASGRKVEAVPVQELRHKTEAAVVVKQKAPTATTPTATSEKTVQPAVRNAAQTPEKKTVPAVEPAQVQKPAATKSESAATAAEKSKAQSETRKSIPVVAEAKPVAKPEATPEARPAAKPEARPEAKPVVAKESIGLNTNKQPASQKKSAQPSDKKEQQPAREKPVAGEKSAANQADNGHENNPKE